MSDDLAFALKRPFDEQVAFFRGKLGNLIPTQTWRDVMREAHDRAFMVAGAAKADLLADLAAAVDRAIADGEGIDAFRRRFRDIVQRRGWQGWTGEGSRAGTNWRTRVIYRTNLATSYAAGRLAQLSAFPLWVYRHSGSEHPRLQHKAWDGLTLPADHQFWQTNYPPNGWGCGCRVVGARTADGAARVGGDPGYDTPPAGWDLRDSRGRLPGIEEGWDYAPGGTAVEALARTMAAKTIAWPYEIAKAYMGAVPPQMRDALAVAQRIQPETGAAVRRYAARTMEEGPADAVEPYRTMGLLTQAEAREISAMTGDQAILRDIYDWVVDRYAPLHIRAGHGDAAKEASRGQQAVTLDDYARLPGLIADADGMVYAGRSDVGRHLVSVTGRYPDGTEATAVFEVLPRRRMLALKTLWKKGRPPVIRP